MEQELQVSNSQRGQGRARADIVIWKNAQERKERKAAFIVVECKAENVTVRKEDYFQGSNYATWARAKFFITHNEKETKFFKVLEEKIPLDIDEIINIPKAADVDNDKKINEILAQTKTFTKDEFQKLLFACHNIIRDNDKLSPEAAFDEISKVLFMKIRYERKQSGIFSKEKFLELKTLKENYEKQVLQDSNKKDDTPFYQYLFEQTKNEFAKDEIFVENDVLKVRETSFLQIVHKLEKYNLSDTSDDVKGIAFEEFLGETFRGSLGQFFTPRTLVNFMVAVLDPKEGEIIADPCCGTGGFLIKAFEYVREKIEQDIQKTKEDFRNQLIPENYDSLSENEQQAIMAELNHLFVELNQDLEPNPENSRVHHLSWNCIFGTDAEPRSARTAKMNMIMHGDGHGGVHHHDGLLNINGIFENRFDVIVTNPPFGMRISKELEITDNDRYKDKAKIDYYTARYGDEYVQALQQINGNINKPLLSLFETGSFSTLSEVVFVERCLNLLRKGGRMGIVLPEGFLNGSDLQKVRDFVESRAKILLIVSVPQEVFISAGATVKSSLVFLKKFTAEEENEYKQIVENVTAEINAKYQPEIDQHHKTYKVLADKVKYQQSYIKEVKAIKTSKSEKETQLMLANMSLSEAKAAQKLGKIKLDKQLKAIDVLIQSEIKAEVKVRFNYRFPIVQAEKAGISSTGQKTDNDLIAIQAEFAEYCLQAKPYQAQLLKYDYAIDESGELIKKESLINF
jgi:type I restriction enzyme M protein